MKNPCKIVYQSPVGWFFWSDLLYENPPRARQVIEKEPQEYRKNLCLAFPDGKGNWTKES
jgi:hypothetical protein